MWVELGGEKRRSALENFVGAAQFAVVLAQLRQLLALLAAQQLLTLAGIGFALAHPLAQCLVMDAQVTGYVGNGAAGLGDHPGAAIEQLVWVLLLSWHGLGVPFFQVGILVSGSPSNPAWLNPILELTAGLEKEAPWVDHGDLLAQSIEPGAILYGALDESNYTSLVWIGRNQSPPRDVTRALEKWRPILENRAEIARNSSRDWWECAWPRDKDAFCRPKVIALYRTDRGRYAVDETGAWRPSNKTTIVVPQSLDTSVAYVGGLLNSELLDLWYSIRGKTPRDVWRNYEPKRMKEIPYRHVDLSIKCKADRLKKFKAVLKKEDAEAAARTASEIATALRASGEAGLAVDSPEAIEAARALEEIVRAIADNRRALLPYRDRFPRLTRVVKDPWSTEAVDPDVDAFVSTLPKKGRASVRVDPELTHSVDTDGVLGRAGFEEESLVFRYRRKQVARVDGPREKLMLLSELVGDRARLMPADLLALEVPRNVDDFKAAVDRARDEVKGLVAAGRTLVEAAERLVCALYAVPAELEDRVVEHAVARAKASASASE